jgi:hypothetical protein
MRLEPQEEMNHRDTENTEESKGNAQILRNVVSALFALSLLSVSLCLCGSFLPNALSVAGEEGSEIRPLPVTADGPRWWKGNLHTHSFWSDGDDFPEMIADWYKTRGYHFLGLSDHNVLSDQRCQRG